MGGLREDNWSGRGQGARFSLVVWEGGVFWKIDKMKNELEGEGMAS